MSRQENEWAESMRAERRGDTVAYERLLREIAVMLRAPVRARLGRAGLSSAEAEDVIQEILIGVHGKRHTWDDARPFMPWLQAITHYKLIDTARRLGRERARRANFTMEEMSEMFAAPAEDMDLALLDIDRHLADLPPSEREVVRALGVDGATVRATAGRLRTSEGAVRVLYHRALKRLRAKSHLGS